MNKYPIVLTLKGTGEAITLLQPQDVLEFVNRYMGPDTMRYIADIISTFEDEDREARLRMNSDLDGYEAELDSNRVAFNDILALVEKAYTEITKERTNKKSVKNCLELIEKTINEQI